MENEHNAEHIKKEGNAREQYSDTQMYLSSLGTYVQSTIDMIREIREPAGRYRSPVSFKDQALLQIEEELLPSAPVARGSLVVQNQKCPIPFRWKKIFNYLYKQGIIQYALPNFDRPYNDEPKVYGVHLSATKPAGKTDGHCPIGIDSRGASLSLEEALSKVVGELLERYSLLLYRNTDLLTVSIRRLRASGKKFLDPFLLDQFSEWQKEKFPRYRFTEESDFRWVKGKSLFSGSCAYIPAQLVYWNYRLAKNESILQQSNTNGAGGMFTKAEALLSGIYELIQRDGFFVYWLNGIAPPRIDTASIRDEKAKKLIASCERYGLEVHILNTTSDIGVPSVIAVIIDTSQKGPAVTLGGGCGPDPDSAIAHSLIEALGVRQWLRNGVKGLASSLPVSFDLPSDYEPFVMEGLNLPQRVAYWSNLGMQKKIRFFLEGQPQTMIEAFGTPPVAKPAPRQEFANLIKIFRAKGKRYEIFYYEVRHPVLDALGYASVSVAVPALLPIYLDEILAPLGNPRIQEACKALGHTPAETINPLPHPFP